MLAQSLYKFLLEKSSHALRHAARNARNIGSEQFENADIKELVKCRSEKEVYLVLVDEKMVNPCWDLPKVVIVGAGMAGLSAAHALVSSGITDVTVLEASDGPGGRILSYDMRSFPVDLGATHIEGATSMNPIFNLACQQGLLRDSLYTSSPYLGSFMTSCGVVLPPDIESAVHYSFENIEKEATDLFRTGKCSTETLWEFFQQKIEEECSVFPELYRGMASRALYGRLNELRGYWGDDFEKFSADQYGAFVKLPGCHVRLSSGMIGTIAPLIRDMPDYSIIYCKPVKQIKWNEIESNDHGAKPVEKKEKKSGKKGKKEANEKEEESKCRPAKVVCEDGTSYDADYVIVTSSLGYLKKHHKSFFSPALPEDKTKSIDKLGWGNLTNIYLLYNEPFWVWKEGLIRLAWSCDELKAKNMWLKGIGSITEVLSSCQMLMVRVAGDEAIEAETLSTKQINDDLTRLIRCFTGDQTLPYPFYTLSSKWHHQEYILGAKSYLAHGATIGDICNLGAPLPGDGCSDMPPVVLFAGEATHSKYFGTLHGARLSGIREAERITKLTHCYQGKPPYDCKSPACTGQISIECCN